MLTRPRPDLVAVYGRSPRALLIHSAAAPAAANDDHRPDWLLITTVAAGIVAGLGYAVAAISLAIRFVRWPL